MCLRVDLDENRRENSGFVASPVGSICNKALLAMLAAFLSCSVRTD